jgi:hypothetical protein
MLLYVLTAHANSVRTKNCIPPDDDSIDSKHVEKCKECKHLGTLIKTVVRIEDLKVNRIRSMMNHNGTLSYHLKRSCFIIIDIVPSIFILKKSVLE